MEAEVIYAYTAEQAVRDGMLVRVPERMSREAGFTVPVYLTANLERSYITPPESVAGTQDYEGRLWDVLWITGWAFREGDPTDRMRTKIDILFVMAPGRQDAVRLWGVIDGAGLTLMLPEDY